MDKNQLAYYYTLRFFFLCTIVFVLFGCTQKQSVSDQSQNTGGKIVTHKDHQKKSGGRDISTFSFGAWIPYWRQRGGITQLQQRDIALNTMSPFSFEVSAYDDIRDPLDMDTALWQDFFAFTRRTDTEIIPTIVWTDSEAMHDMFSDEQKRTTHITKLLTIAKDQDFSGIDIDYEGKDLKSRDLFSAFLKELSDALHAKQKILTCTVESRTQDAPPEGITGINAMAFANDYVILGTVCDRVRIMAYDQIFQSSYHKKILGGAHTELYTPNADILWVEGVIDYTLHFIPKEKLELGVPTYGWEFSITKDDDVYSYRRVRSISYPDAIALAHDLDKTPLRDTTGELHFIFRGADGTDHIVWFSDAHAIAQKIELAKKRALRGVYLFKIDGFEDPALWDLLPKNSLPPS